MNRPSNTITGQVARSGKVLKFYDAEGKLERVVTFLDSTSALREQRRVSHGVKLPQGVKRPTIHQ